MIIKAVLVTIKKHKALSARQVKSFALRFKIGTDKLTVAQDKLIASLKVLLLTLPEPLVDVNIRQFLTSRKRAMTS